MRSPSGIFSGLKQKGVHMSVVLTMLAYRMLIFPLLLIYAFFASVYLFLIGWIFRRNRQLILDICPLVSKLADKKIAQVPIMLSRVIGNTL